MENNFAKASCPQREAFARLRIVPALSGKFSQGCDLVLPQAGNFRKAAICSCPKQEAFSRQY